MALFDSAELLTTIKNRGMVPTNSGAWDDDALLKAASDEIETWHLPLLVNARGEYLVKEVPIACVVNQESYLISYRAAAIRSVSLKWSNGVEQPLEELSPEKQARLVVDRTVKGVPLFYKFREGYIDLYPIPNSTNYSLLVKWHIAPNRLELTANTRQISSKAIDTPTAGKTRLTLLTAAPSALAGASGTTLYDIVGMRKPFSIKGWDVTCQSSLVLGASTIDFLTADLPTDLLTGAVSGDFLCRPQRSPFPNVPSELHSAIALRAAAAPNAARNQSLQAALIGEAVGKERELLNGILAPRNKGGFKRLVNRRW